jgi:outer membrane lipoprotein SlyB
MTTAFDLGCFAADALIKESASFLTPENITSGLGSIAGHGVLGAGVGGMLGGILPGHDVDEDGAGNLTAKKRSRLAGMLRGAGIGALSGSAIGTGRIGLHELGNALTKESKENKKPYGMPQFGTQQFLPIDARREFTPEEQERVDEGQSRWLPRIFTSYATDPAETMASPTKQGLLTGLLGAGVGGLAGAHLGGMSKDPSGAGVGGLIGAGLGGLVGGVGGMWNRQAENDSTEELMRRLPPGARMRDIMSDPVFQRDSDRSQNAAQSAAMIAAMRSMR